MVAVTAQSIACGYGTGAALRRLIHVTNSRFNP